MRVQFTDTDSRLQMRIKTVFDPRVAAEPGKVFPLDGRAERRQWQRREGKAQFVSDGPEARRPSWELAAA